MKVTVERTPESEAVLNVELEWGELEKASDRAYRKLAQKYNVPGFRPGKAPRTMLERMLGKEAIYQEGLEDLIETSYRDAIRENSLTPIAQPSVDAPEIQMGQPYSYTARVAILPPVELGDYHAVRVAQPSTEVTDEDVEKVLEQVRQDQAMWLPAERPAQIGDKVVVDLKLTAGDRDVSDLHDNEFELADERVGIFSGMDEHIVGMTEGETKEFTTTIPEDYANTELAGKEAQYTVTLKGVKFRELPEIDDELAKTIGDYENVEALKAAVREQLTSQKQSEARRELRDQAVKAVVDQSTVEAHPILVEDEIDAMLNETNRMLSQSRLTLEQYLSMTGKSEEEYRKDLEPEAQERVKRDLVLDAIAEAEGMSATDAEVAGWLELIAAMGGQRIRANQLSRGQRANIEARIRRDKATQHIVDIATEGHADDDQAATATTAENVTAEDTEAGVKAAAKAAAKAATKTTAEVPSEAAITEPQADIPAPTETDV